jgi:rhamnosyltransferase
MNEIINNRIFAVTITYNPEIDLLKEQLKSLDKQVTGIIIVDNGSKNQNELEACFNSIKNELSLMPMIIRNKQNMGLGYAQNQGATLAISHSASHVLMLDQDSVLQINFVQNLLKSEEALLNENVRVGALGPTYYNEKTGEIYPITRYKGPFIDRIKPDKYPVEASFLIASGCLIRSEVLHEVGLMNEELFIDYIDVEWSFRTKEKGYKLYAIPTAKMKHSIGDSRASILGRKISVHSPLRRYYLYRNSFYMVRRKYIPFGYKLRELVFNTLRFIIFLFLSKDRIKYCKYSLAGFVDGIKGIKGECPHKFI